MYIIIMSNVHHYNDVGQGMSSQGKKRKKRIPSGLKRFWFNWCWRKQCGRLYITTTNKQTIKQASKQQQ